MVLFYIISSGLELAAWSAVKVTKGLISVVWPSKSLEEIMYEDISIIKKELADLRQDLDLDIVVLPKTVCIKTEDSE